MDREPTRSEINALRGPVVLEFGASWCGHCIAMQSQLGAQFARFPQMKHIKVEDAKGRPLGRSFRVKLWPTFVFMHDGRITSQLVRPSADELRTGFDELAGAAKLGSR